MKSCFGNSYQKIIECIDCKVHKSCLRVSLKAKKEVKMTPKEENKRAKTMALEIRQLEEYKKKKFDEFNNAKSEYFSTIKKIKEKNHDLLKALIDGYDEE